MNWDLRTSKWKLNFHEVRSGTKVLITEFSERKCARLELNFMTRGVEAKKTNENKLISILTFSFSLDFI